MQSIGQLFPHQYPIFRLSVTIERRRGISKHGYGLEGKERWLLPKEQLIFTARGHGGDAPCWG
jgi:hypothetical protein